MHYVVLGLVNNVCICVCYLSQLFQKIHGPPLFQKIHDPPSRFTSCRWYTGTLSLPPSLLVTVSVLAGREGREGRTFIEFESCGC